MKKSITLFLFLVLSVITIQKIHAQEFSLDEYKDFLNQYQNMEAAELYSIWPVGMYEENALSQPVVKYLQQVNDNYRLTNYESMLLEDHNFVVTERLGYHSFWEAFGDVYHKDLPVFISTDAILHSIHKSYDALLMELEYNSLKDVIDDVLLETHQQIREMKDEYSGNDEIIQSLKDADIYLAVPRKLLTRNPESINPVFSDNYDKISKYMTFIESEYPVKHEVFGATREMDYSQFTIRGHYSQHPDLGRYFRAMIWLGRTEIYLINPDSEWIPNPGEPNKRGIITSYLMLQALQHSGTLVDLNKMDEVIKAIVGESDNVKFEHLLELYSEAGVDDVTDLTDDKVIDKFADILESKPYASQKILSQILRSNAWDTDQIVPASAFLFFGQRFIIDSYVTSKVVYDRIIYHDRKMGRLLPMCYDVLFALGNNAAADFLKDELEKYKYSLNLSSLRYLIDSYDDDYWQNTYYTSWLNMIRQLNAPENDAREALPKFMQTAAFWQQKMNTQLASWAQLRHDNLLYAKQSYTGGGTCSYPEGYVEPFPSFYDAVTDLAKLGHDLIIPRVSELPGNNYTEYFIEKLDKYFTTLSNYSDTLKTIAEKELHGGSLTEDEKYFLSTTYSQHTQQGCVVDTFYTGWYSKLFFKSPKDAGNADYIVADVHTVPTDMHGAPLGWVWHVGTGAVNMAVVIAENCEGDEVAFCGPVLSYYEYVTENFDRYTDERWEEEFLEQKSEAARPEFTHLYLADKKGSSKSPDPPSLPVRTTSVEENIAPSFSVTAFPNPFSDYVNISFTLPQKMAYSNVKVEIYDQSGHRVKSIVEQELPATNYILKWDGTDEFGNEMPTGVYMFRVMIGDTQSSGRITLVR